ncbi:MAG: SpoVG family protein [Oscillospiraceae bacterium]|nr:SpoVG family protein [Oscillospiraceae bacterium]
MNEPMAPEANMERPTPLDVSVKITPVAKDSNLLAFANVTLGGCFAVTGIRVMDSEKGIFVAMPDKKNSKGEYHDVCFPTTPEMRKVLHSAVLGEYQHTMEQLVSRGEKSRASVRDALQNAAKTARRPAPEAEKAPQQRRAAKEER